MTALPLAPRALERLLPGVNPLVRGALLALLGSALLWASAKVQVPFWPVPMTMQSMVVVLIGAWYGPRLGAATVLLYLAEGAAGLPVFAGTPEKGLGIAYMLGTTGGFLAGFVAAAFAAGLVYRALGARPIVAMLVAGVVGHVVLFVPGWAWLATFVGAEKAFALGVAPFLVGSLAKIGLAGALAPLAARARL